MKTCHGHLNSGQSETKITPGRKSCLHLCMNLSCQQPVHPHTRVKRDENCDYISTTVLFGAMLTF